MATLEKGIAFSACERKVRGTYDGKYTVIDRPYRMDRTLTDEEITDVLRKEFARGNCLPISGGMNWDVTRVV